MKRSAMFVGALALFASFAKGVELRMQWEGLEADARTVELAVGEQAVFEVHLDGLVTADTLSGVFFEHEDASGLLLVDAVTDLAGWSTTVASGTTFGDPGEQVIYAANSADAVIDGPGDQLMGTVTLELQSGNVGDEFEITFNLGLTSILDGVAVNFTRTPTGSAAQDDVRRYHVGAGSPGYTQLGMTDVRDPLIVRVKAGSTGGGGGGGGGGGTGGGGTGGDTGDGDTGDGDTTGDGTADTGDGDTGDGGAGDGTGDTGDGDTGTGDTGTGDTGTGDTGTGDTGTGDTGTGDTGTGDTGGGDTGSGDTGTGDTNNGDNSTGGGLCGFGAASMLPIMLLGLVGLKSRQRAVLWKK